MKKPNTIVISLGGSIIVPGEIQTDFLKKFKEFILKYLKKGTKFLIVSGGGNICRKYQKAAAEISKVTDEDKDWIGVHSTRLNAHLLRTIFKKKAYPVVLDNPLKKINGKKYKLFIASGWKPGWSTDYDAVLLAERFKADKIINASNIDYIYEQDINLHKTAKPIKEINWKDYLKIINSKWSPGMNVPFDPVASKKAKNLKMKVIVAKGTDLKNLEKILEGKEFKGTIIHP
ncbi:MAG: UMP kinase [Candidatus Nealsonbacteria bacterium]